MASSDESVSHKRKRFFETKASEKISMDFPGWDSDNVLQSLKWMSFENLLKEQKIKILALNEQSSGLGLLAKILNF